MNRSTIGRCVAAMAICAGASVSLGALTDINKQIKCGDTLLATVNFATPTLFSDGAKGGITVSGSATKTAAFTGKMRWVQMIKTNKPLNTATPANTPYFDPGELDPSGNDFPFYWNENLKGRDGNEYPNLWVDNKFSNGGNTLAFFDQPNRTWTGQAIDWQAELSLVCWDMTTNVLGVLWTGTYGFNITAGGLLTINGMTEMAVGGTFLTQAAIDQRFGDEYTITTDCTQCIPTPAAASVLAFAGVFAARRRRAA
ncbi:MAG TPA: hypothetical protein VF777_04335 [Phycisphaerales bacterium]